MRKVLIPYQQDLHGMYSSPEGVAMPLILNMRFLDWVNRHPDMIACAISYDDGYLDAVRRHDGDIAVLLPGGDDLGKHLKRDAFELFLIDACVEGDVPLFGICKGLQLLNVYCGGTLRKCEGHWQSHVPQAPTHRVRLAEGLFLNHCIQRELSVNSFHRWCVDEVGEGVKVCGTDDSEEQVVERIRLYGKPIAAVQWHPSFMLCHYTSDNLLELFYSLGRRGE